ncbi:DUF3817 domain-containing protein [Sphingobacterium sp. Mn56C]|uniref:DUF3817 domain-containing protein n=1 Tax=Sphingobacterium sp. Mn56C TaxID=3395261 RepID=UPI003BC55BD3
MDFCTVWLKHQVGRLRLLSYLEGFSLLFLLLVALPLKYLAHAPILVKIMGPIHGVLFLLFMLQSIQVSVEQHWKFKQTTWKVWLACFIPLGTLYVDRFILKPLAQEQQRAGRGRTD